MDILYSYMRERERERERAHTRDKKWRKMGDRDMAVKRDKNAVLNRKKRR